MGIELFFCEIYIIVRGNLSYKLICKPLVAVGKMDDAAIAESVCQNDVLHDAVVCMCVDAQINASLKAKVEAKLEDAVCRVPFGDAVNGGVGKGVVNPLSAVDDVVSRLYAWNEGKSSHDVTVLLYHVAHVTADVLLNLLLRRIGIGPLMKVSVGTHLLACFLEDGHQRGDVFGKGVADRYHD